MRVGARHDARDGCIQSLRCNTDHCPTGITTQDPALVYGLEVGDKSERVARFQRETVKAFMELLGAMGLHNPRDIQPQHIFRRIDDLRVRNLGELYDFLEPGQLLHADGIPEDMREEWNRARPHCWSLAPETGQYGGDALREERTETGG